MNHISDSNYIVFLLIRIRYFDVLILIPNLIFLLFLIIKWIRTRSKLNIHKPLLLTVTCLLLIITFANILRCLFVMIFPDHKFKAQEIIVKVMQIKNEFSIRIMCFFRFFGYVFDLLYCGQN